MVGENIPSHLLAQYIQLAEREKHPLPPTMENDPTEEGGHDQACGKSGKVEKFVE